ncbi:MAG: hypothetical protein VYA54_06155 [Bdellovibrionota bacterium]|nr:hypothetical protein [Bdellovibrionota bacterium]
MNTNENLSLKNSEKKVEHKPVQLNVAPTKSLRPQKSMMRVKSVRPNRVKGLERLRVNKF